jgi:uncharacterized protein (TIGR02646 family)
MIYTESVPLPQAVLDDLRGFQAAVDSVADYPSKVTFARSQFEGKNTGTNPTFTVVRHFLKQMCAGTARCMYCEDSMACDVEHFKPKAFYPELVFAWSNFLYACGLCNRTKRHTFRVETASSQHIDLIRRRGQPVLPPMQGSPVLIDPRREDPLEFMTLDLNTFRFQPRAGLTGSNLARTKYTIKLLKLNERDLLPEARRKAYEDYRARLREYIAVKGTADAAPLKDAMCRYRLSTVWHEMKSQAARVPELADLFRAAPEALDWR